MAVAPLADHDLTTIFNKTSVKIYHNSAVDTALQTIQEAPLLEGQRDPHTRLWQVDVPPPPQQINSVYHQKNKSDLARFLHATAGSPVVSTWIAAIKRGYYATWPGLTAELITRFLPKSEATLKGVRSKTRNAPLYRNYVILYCHSVVVE